jgi:hypothetical protein
VKLRQAELVRGKIHTVVWIPKELCKKDRELFDKNGLQWQVLNAYLVELEHEDIAHGWKVGGLI